ncbi:Riboflavin biosynthesis intermediates N-glycosidase (modular protein) [uncultured Gammaproteobacteria bacterium]
MGSTSLRAKFTQHEDLRELLLSTGDAKLIESATVDNEVNRLWGEVNGVGRNMLGVLLMELRADLLGGDAGFISSQANRRAPFFAAEPCGRSPLLGA